MARVPIICLGNVLIVTILEDLRDSDAMQLQEDVLTMVERKGARGVLIDISVIECIDSFLGRLLNDIALGSRLLGAEVVLAGIRPAVAITLVELGVELKMLHTAPDADKGWLLLRRRMIGPGTNGLAHDR